MSGMRPGWRGTPHGGEVRVACCAADCIPLGTHVRVAYSSRSRENDVLMTSADPYFGRVKIKLALLRCPETASTPRRSKSTGSSEATTETVQEIPMIDPTEEPARADLLPTRTLPGGHSVALTCCGTSRVEVPRSAAGGLWLQLLIELGAPKVPSPPISCRDPSPAGSPN